MVTLLQGWENYVELDIPAAELDADLSWFPIVVKLGASVGRNSKDLRYIMQELGANWNKIAFATSTGNQLFYEKELWDTTNLTAVFHVSKNDLTLDSTNGTKLYLYWNPTQSDNTGYGGVTGSTPAEAVWDANFKLVCHMDDNPDTSSVMDSTSNDNDGTKKAANEPIEATGIIGKGQNFVPIDDYIALTNSVDLKPETGDFSVFAWINLTDVTDYRVVIADCPLANEGYYLRIEKLGGHLTVYLKSAEGDNKIYVDNQDLSDGVPHLVGFTWDNSEDELKLYVDGSLITPTKWADDDLTGDDISNVIVVRLGLATNGFYPFDGIEDEVQVTKSVITPVWVGASYETQRDHFINYGDKQYAATTHGPPVPRPTIPLKFIRLTRDWLQAKQKIAN